MIAKHIALRSPKRSNFAALASYITDPQNKSERLGSVSVTNCEAASLQAVICEVLATQLANSRAQGDKTYHLLLSFPTGEYPNDDKLKKIEARICEGLGFAEHQRLSAVHRDTDNLHLHIAINKIHPTKNTFFEPFQAYKTLANLCVELEKEHRLREENHQAHQSVSQGRVADMEHHSGTESLNHWLKRECLGKLRAAATWQALHQVLSEHDLEIRPRANGLVIGSAATAWVKASTIARDLGKSQLEARLGPFVHKNAQINTPIKSRYEKRPIGFRKETAALYAQYQSEQQQLGAARRLAWQKLRYQKETHFAAAKRADKMQRSLIKVLGGGRFLQKILFAQAKESWKGQITELRQQNLHQRQQLAAQYPRLAWADWLKQQALRGNLQALELLRSREQAQGLLGNAIMAVKAGQKLETSSLPIDNITKQGTLILRTKVGAIRDDGDKLQVSTAAGDEVIATALRLALARFGSEIDVQGTWRFREQVVRVAISGKIALSFADPELETSRREAWLQMREQEQAAILKNDDSPKHRL